MITYPQVFITFKFFATSDLATDLPNVFYNALL